MENRRIVDEKSLIFYDFWVPKWWLEASKSELGNDVDFVRNPGDILVILVVLGYPGSRVI